jgi:O-antigen/teichoic acid export membrane protein
MTGTLPPPAVRPRGAAFGLGWSAATQVAGTVVRLASTLLLTRLLAPDAYALLGTAMVVLTTLEWLSDLGVTAALVRHPKGGEAGWLLVGWRLNLHRGVGLAVAAAAAAAPLAAFYQQPDLT